MDAGNHLVEMDESGFSEASQILETCCVSVEKLATMGRRRSWGSLPRVEKTEERV